MLYCGRSVLDYGRSFCVSSVSSPVVHVIQYWSCVLPCGPVVLRSCWPLRPGRPPARWWIHRQGFLWVGTGLGTQIQRCIFCLFSVLSCGPCDPVLVSFVLRTISVVLGAISFPVYCILSTVLGTISVDDQFWTTGDHLLSLQCPLLWSM